MESYLAPRCSNQSSTADVLDVLAVETPARPGRHLNSQREENPHRNGTPNVHKAVNHFTDGMTAFDAFPAAAETRRCPPSRSDDANEDVAERLPVASDTEE